MDLAPAGLLLLQQETKERGLSGPGGPDQKHELALVDLEVAVIEGDHRVLVGLGDVLAFDHDVVLRSWGKGTRASLAKDPPLGGDRAGFVSTSCRPRPHARRPRRGRPRCRTRRRAPPTSRTGRSHEPPRS